MKKIIYLSFAIVLSACTSNPIIDKIENELELESVVIMKEEPVDTKKVAQMIAVNLADYYAYYVDSNQVNIDVNNKLMKEFPDDKSKWNMDFTDYAEIDLQIKNRKELVKSHHSKATSIKNGIPAGKIYFVSYSGGAGVKAVIFDLNGEINKVATASFERPYKK
jgi:hypothetical protein